MEEEPLTESKVLAIVTQVLGLYSASQAEYMSLLLQKLHKGEKPMKTVPTVQQEFNDFLDKVGKVDPQILAIVGNFKIPVELPQQAVEVVSAMVGILSETVDRNQHWQNEAKFQEAKAEHNRLETHASQEFIGAADLMEKLLTRLEASIPPLEEVKKLQEEKIAAQAQQIVELQQLVQTREGQLRRMKEAHKQQRQPV